MSVSFLFTLTVLVGTVVAIYVVFPARHNVLLTEALDRHRDAAPAWDLVEPSLPELRAWAIGAIEKDVPLPNKADKILGARTVTIHDRRAAVVRVVVDNAEVTYLVQHAKGMAPKRSERTDEDLKAVAWRAGKFTCVVVGPAATSQAWVAALVPAKK